MVQRKDTFFQGPSLKRQAKKLRQKRAVPTPEQVDESSENDIEALDLKHDIIASDEDDPFFLETPVQKRLRLAKAYLSKMKEDTKDGTRMIDVDIMEGEIDAKQIDNDLISERLAKMTDEGSRGYTRLADSFTTLDYTKSRRFKSAKGHQLSLTCICVSKPDTSIFLYSGSKDAVIVKWDYYTGMRLCTFAGGLKATKRLIGTIGKRNLKHEGHSNEVLCIDASSDGRFVVSFVVCVDAFASEIEENVGSFDGSTVPSLCLHRTSPISNSSFESSRTYFSIGLLEL